MRQANACIEGPAEASGHSPAERPGRGSSMNTSYHNEVTAAGGSSVVRGNTWLEDLQGRERWMCVAKAFKILIMEPS